GSGKTRVIAAKIAHLAASGIDPGEIAAITFTNKAAREMRERVTAAAKVGAADAGEATISTFHALGLAIMRREAKALGIKPGFSILDPSDLEPIVAELVATADRRRARSPRPPTTTRAPRRAPMRATPTRWPLTRRSTSTT